MVSVLHKNLEYKVQTLKNKKLEVMQPRIKKTNPVHTKFNSCDWLIYFTIY